MIPPASIQQLKQKLKAEKRQKNSGWTESPSKGEIEIVIPNKKFKGSAKLHSVQSLATPEVTLSNTLQAAHLLNYSFRYAELHKFIKEQWKSASQFCTQQKHRSR